jgi:hypothetical protein
MTMTRLVINESFLIGRLLLLATPRYRAVGGGLFVDRGHGLHPPFIPEVNEFYGQEMHYEYDELRIEPGYRLRIEPGRIGIVIEATDSDAFLYALPARALMQTLFGMAGFSVKLSLAGLTVRQLIA